jgi:hypothetical protein
MSRLLEFFLGSILMTMLAISLLVFSVLHYILGTGSVDDCAWHSSAKTWVDANGDGLINTGERPLSAVEIHIDDVQNQRIDVGWPTITDKNGDARLTALVLMLGCSDVLFEVYANPPEGYRITTKPRIEVNRDVSGSFDTESVYYFGFTPDK